MLYYGATSAESRNCVLNLSLITKPITESHRKALQLSFTAESHTCVEQLSLIAELNLVAESLRFLCIRLSDS